MSLRKLAKDLSPPILTRAFQNFLQRYGLIGDYPSWEAVAAAVPPYNTDLSKAGAATDRVRRGEQGIGHSFFPTVSGILLAGDNVRVLDFGGCLGVSYFHVTQVIPDRIKWWRVVDISEVVEYGRANFASNKLSFFPSINEALAGETPEVILCGGVLQYIENPYATLVMLLKAKPHILILDRVPLYRRERFMIQRRGPELGYALVAYRILGEDKLQQAVHGYKLIGEQCAGSLEFQNPRLKEERYVSQVFTSSDG